ncbi:MAG: DedA family protein [Cyanobacteria bacterium HKST-UBA03]|nr:DedA family protein [Cyanobacteria bacterium HKST-UBA03]
MHVEQFMSWTGYAGVVLLMAIESCNIPLPSEIILPFAGILVADGKLNYHGAAFAGALGCVVGSLPSYWLGLVGGRPFLEKHGKWLLLTHRDLQTAESWVDKYGDWAFFLCRMLPIVRTFISLPAGILKAHFWPFVLYTFFGSLIWSYGLVYVGVVFGRHREVFRHYWHQFDFIIVTVMAVGLCWYVYKHMKHMKAFQDD